VTDPTTATTTTTTTATPSNSLPALKKIEELLFSRGVGDVESSDAYLELRGEVLDLCERVSDAAVREWLVNVIERASLELLLPLNRLVSLAELDVLVRRMLRDTNVRVLCAVVRCATRLFRPLHSLLFRSARDSVAEGVLAQLQQLRPLIADKGLVHEHDSVRIRTVKFIELAALCYSAPDVPPDFARDLRDTAEELARTLLAYVRATSHVSSAAAAVASLAALVRQRDAAFAEPLVDGLLRLVAEAPPHLTASYIASLHHLIRVLLIALLRRNLDSLAGVAHDMLECLANELAVPHNTIRQLGAHYGGGKRARAADESRRVRARPAASTQQLLDALPPMHLMPPSLLAALVVGFMNNLPARPAASSAAAASATTSTMAATAAAAAPTINAPLELDAVEALNDDDSVQLAHDAFERILAAEASVVRSGSSALRVQLLARLASLKPLDDASVGALLEHIGADFDQRFELALGWLYNEMHDHERYEPIVHELLRRVDDGALAGVRLVVAAPILPRSVLEHLVDDVALEALYQICVQRPADAEPALAAVLRFAGSDDAGVRGEATRIVVSQMLPHEHLASAIVEFASAQFQQAFTGAGDDEVERKSALFFALCGQRPALLSAVIDVYTDLDDSKRRVIHGQLAPLVRQIGQASAELLQVIDQAASRAPTLAVHVLHTLTERERPERALRDAVEAAYARTKEARLLVPMLAAFDAAAVRRLLPALLMLNKAFIRNMVERLVHREAPYWSPLAPAELLVALHQLDDDSKSVAGAIVALNAAFESRTAITQEAVAVALQQLVAVRGRKPPLLLLRTVLLALQYYPALARFVCTNVLPPLIQTKIWDDAPRWQGFVKCCARTLPRSCSVLVQLPTSIFANILDESSEFVRPMVAYAREARLDDKRIAILTSAAKKLRSNR
jgi:hypothetical protein